MSSDDWDKVIFYLSTIVLIILAFIGLGDYDNYKNKLIYNEGTITKRITKVYNNNNELNNDIKIKIDTIAKVLWCEDRTNRTGMELVMSVIHNRASSKTIEGLYNEVIRPYQFECYTKLKKGLIKINSKKHDLEMYSYAKKLLISYYNKKFSPITKAKFFYNLKLLKNKHPKWALNKNLVAVYNGHWFYE